MVKNLKTQYHHYIPQFILKTFDDNFSLNVSDYFATIPDLFVVTPIPDGSVQADSGRKRKRTTRRRREDEAKDPKEQAKMEEPKKRTKVKEPKVKEPKEQAKMKEPKEQAKMEEPKKKSKVKEPKKKELKEQAKMEEPKKAKMREAIEQDEGGGANEQGEDGRANEQGEGGGANEQSQVADIEGESQSGGVKKENNSIRTTEDTKKPDYQIKVYHAASRTVSLNSVRRSYGVQDLYRDVSEENWMKFEILLSKMECTSSRFIREIWAGQEDLSLTRSQLTEMKKFLVIMTYRSNNRRDQYKNDRFSASTRQSILMHMRHKNIKRIQDVWFDNLKWIIETPADDIMEEYRKAIVYRAKMMMTFSMDEYQGPIHIAELVEFGNMCTNLMCIWQAEEGSEFILSEGCFGAWEGDGREPFHTFYIVSPRYAIILVNRLQPWNWATHLPFKSWFEGDIHANPETVYTKGPPPSNFTSDHFSPTDEFKYKRIVVPKEDVYFVNSIFLDARRESLTYKSNLSMYRSVQYYDMMKRWRPDLFKNGHDYSLLKRKLVADMGMS